MRDVTFLYSRALFRFLFLLTRPMRDVTPLLQLQDLLRGISTHTSHAGRDSKTSLSFILGIISTHTSHAGRDSAVP